MRIRVQCRLSRRNQTRLPSANLRDTRVVSPRRKSCSYNGKNRSLLFRDRPAGYMVFTGSRWAHCTTGGTVKGALSVVRRCVRDGSANIRETEEFIGRSVKLFRRATADLINWSNTNISRSSQTQQHESLVRSRASDCAEKVLSIFDELSQFLLIFQHSRCLLTYNSCHNPCHRR